MTDIEKAWGRRLSSSMDNHDSWTVPQTVTDKALARLKDFVEKYNEGRTSMKWYNFTIEFEFNNGISKDVEGKVIAESIMDAYNKVVAVMSKDESGFEEDNITLFEAYTYDEELEDVIITSRRVFDKEEDV